MDDTLRLTWISRMPWLVPVAGLGLVGVLSLTPLIVEQRPIRFLAPYESPVAAVGCKLLVLAAMLAILAIRYVVESRQDSAACFRIAGLALLAAVLTTWHAYWVDSVPFKSE